VRWLSKPACLLATMLAIAYRFSAILPCFSISNRALLASNWYLRASSASFLPLMAWGWDADGIPDTDTIPTGGGGNNGYNDDDDDASDDASGDDDDDDDDVHVHVPCVDCGVVDASIRPPLPCSATGLGAIVLPDGGRISVVTRPVTIDPGLPRCTRFDVRFLMASTSLS
jgi:hypothetical protein